MKRKTLVTSLALALALVVTGAIAQGQAGDAAKQKELEAARADLHRAAERVAELSRELGVHGPMMERFVEFHAEQHGEQRPMVGVLLEPDDAAGVRIADVVPDGAAAKAGLRGGDRLLSINGRAITGEDGDARLDDASNRLRALDTKTPAKLGYERDGRRASLDVTPTLGDHLMRLRNFEHPGMHPPAMGGMDERVIVMRDGVAPEIRREIIRMGHEGACRDGDCMLAEAFRLTGLNLASVDKQLGHYFGTDHGVLILSIPDQMGGLKAGDIVQKVNGKPVNTPREAMVATHSQPAGTKIKVEYLRDRQVASTTLALPERRALPVPPPPPAAPAPPIPPEPPQLAPPPPPPAPAAPPPPPAPPAAPMALL
ncbi:PDZ domain-containing protein [Lysobacter fragariae]